MFNFSRSSRIWRLPMWNDWRQNALLSPAMEVENSITSRVLVSALVMVGIVARDIAAETRFSLWAVSLSMVGAIWSYYHRLVI